MAKPASTSAAPLRPYSSLIYGVLLLSSFAGLYVMHVDPISNGVPDGLHDIVRAQKFKDGTSLKTTYTGIQGVDYVLSTLVTSFYAGPARWNEAVRLQQLHFLINFFAVLCIWNVEAYRKRNAGRLLSYPLIFAFLVQTIGGATLSPLWCIALLVVSNSKQYFASTREVPLGAAKVLLPATVLGYLAPTIATYFIPGVSVATLQSLVAIWQFAPLLVNFFLWLSPLFQPSGVQPKNADVKYLQRVYLVAGMVSAITHVGTIWVILTTENPNTTFSTVFLPSKIAWKSTSMNGVHYIFQMDWWGTFITSVAGCLVMTLDVMRLRPGGLRTGQLIQAVVSATAITVVAGPGAAVAALWSWREGQLVRLEGSTSKKAKTK